MAHVLFWEKPGCANNRRQKQWLLAAGHSLDVRNLLEEAWTPERLRPFLAGLPVAEWFNRSAPAIKEGRIAPDNLDGEIALALMVADPLLIRRPLMQVGDVHRVGFVPEVIAAWIGLNPGIVISEPEICQHRDAGQTRGCG